MSQTHDTLVKRLIKPPHEILEQMTREKCAILHAVLGVQGEFMEFIMGHSSNDKDNILEEAGDILFYLRDLHAIAKTIPDQRMEDLPGGDGVFEDLIPGDAHTDMIDIAKKYAIYNQELTTQKRERLVECVAVIRGAVMEILMFHGFSEEEAINHNIKKLNARYPEGGYSDAAAASRADKADDDLDEPLGVPQCSLDGDGPCDSCQ